MITRIIHSEAEYLNLIADTLEFGVHCPNQFAKGDEDGLSAADHFDKFPVEELYQLLGVYLVDEPLPDTLIKIWEEDKVEWERHADHISEWKIEYRDKLRIFSDNPTVCTPEPKDYPIIIYWYWIDDWDRMGDIKERTFQWWSIKKLVSIPKDSIKKTKELWETKYRALVDELAENAKEKRNLNCGIGGS